MEGGPKAAAVGNATPAGPGVKVTEGETQLSTDDHKGGELNSSKHGDAGAKSTEDGAAAEEQGKERIKSLEEEEEEAWRKEEAAFVMAEAVGRRGARQSAREGEALGAVGLAGGSGSSAERPIDGK